MVTKERVESGGGQKALSKAVQHVARNRRRTQTVRLASHMEVVHCQRDQSSSCQFWSSIHHRVARASRARTHLTASRQFLSQNMKLYREGCVLPIIRFGLLSFEQTGGQEEGEACPACSSAKQIHTADGLYMHLNLPPYTVLSRDKRWIMIGPIRAVPQGERLFS